MHLKRKDIENNQKKLWLMEMEAKRLDEMSIYEKNAHSKGIQFVAGIDEAGRGPLAGPVVAAAVILPQDVSIYGLNDSKQLSAKKRDVLYDEIKQKALSFGVGIVDENCIDEINILNATKKAMKSAVEALKPQPGLLLIDAVKLDDCPIDQMSIIKGDCLSISIAAASIIAKVTRDRMMDELDTVYPQYGFLRHKGYGTRDHIAAIKKYGICPIHRISFTRKFV
jgi:ribonuclease HII